MSALTDAETRAARPTARPTAWRDGQPSEAECPVCGLEFGVYPNGGLHPHGPPVARCRGSQARVAPAEQAEPSTPPTVAPEWTDADAQAVHDLYVAARALDPVAVHSTLWARAARSHFSRTGRLRSHGLSGYVTGCRCRVCRQEMSDYQRGRRQAVDQ